MDAESSESSGDRLPAARGAASLLTDALREIALARSERERNSPHPPEAGLVLDVGAGQSAHPRANVVVDKYIEDDFERGAALDLSKPLVVADAAKLPFADGTFAYSIASHVLEHATDPVQMAAELSRVSAAGFVQVPSDLAELTFGWPFHPWLVERGADGLRFTPRDGARAPRGDTFHAFYDDSALFRLFWASHRSSFHLSVEWTGELPVEVAGESRAEQTASVDVERTLAALDAGKVRGPDRAIRAALRCPACGGRLSDAKGALECDGCDRAYPVAGSVPVLLEEAAGAAA